MSRARNSCIFVVRVPDTGQQTVGTLGDGADEFAADPNVGMQDIPSNLLLAIEVPKVC
ncbi:MAG: hypothetical protein WAN05_13445 [Roseiarcus sp.]|jgi:hypothetical protein